MGKVCVVPYCRASRARNGVTLHVFPKDPEWLKIWIEQIIQYSEPVELTAKSRICSKHFEKKYFWTKRCGRKMLLPNAVPTIFESHSPLTSDKSVSDQDVKFNEVPPKRLHFVGDFKIEHMSDAETAKIFFTCVMRERKKLLLDNKKLKTQNQRLQKRLQDIDTREKFPKKKAINFKMILSKLKVYTNSNVGKFQLLFTRTFRIAFNINKTSTSFSYLRQHYNVSAASNNISYQNKNMSEFTIPNDTPIKLLDCIKAFSGLTNKEKLYAHYLSKASFYGGLIVLSQTSLESPLIFVLLHKLFKAQPIKELKQIALEKCDFTEDEFTAILVYTAGIFSNMGNYKGFGDTKFVPNLSKEKFKKLITSSKAAELEQEKMQNLLLKCIDPMFSLGDGEKQLGFPYIGKTTYLSKNFTKEDNEIVKEFFKKQGLDPTNTRLIKTFDAAGTSCYEIRLASVLQTDDAEEKDVVSTHAVNGHKFFVTRGDYSKILKIVNKNLHLAKEYALNENEAKMLEYYIHSFHTGSLDSHKEGSRYWIKDKGPVIESYIGFIETYRDPAGMRAEFEGFVALVNKEMSVKFTDLVNAATNLLPLLPWPAEYEKDTFLQPDFTSLDVLTFAGSGVPAGICIPNYQEIRQYEGFKNVSLGNVISSRSVQSANFLNQDDQELLEKYYANSFEVRVGLHELLGHGSGKLFQKNKDGILNFDVDAVKHLETGEKITKFYENGETYDSVFGALGSPYEECRAECVGLYLSLESDVLKIFGYEGTEAEKILRCCWLDLLYSGIEALKMYEPKTNSWLQAHAQARYVILQVCLEAAEGFVNLENVKGADGNPDLLLHIDYNKLKTVGKKAIGDFLRKLQLYRATADITAAKAMFDKFSAVTSEDKYPFLNYREIVMARKKPRGILAQANTVAKDGNIHLITYESSPEGLIQSWIDRFEEEENIYEILEEIREKDRLHF